MSLRKLKNIFGALDLNTVKNIIKNTKRGISILRDVDNIADRHNIEIVKNITDKLLASKNFKKLEGGLEVGDRLISAVEQSKKSGLFNKTDAGINNKGERFAVKKRREVLDNPLGSEQEVAENIVRNMR